LVTVESQLVMVTKVDEVSTSVTVAAEAAAAKRAMATNCIINERLEFGKLLKKKTANVALLYAGAKRSLGQKKLDGSRDCDPNKQTRRAHCVAVTAPQNGTRCSYSGGRRTWCREVCGACGRLAQSFLRV
jgi:hypothetical protein